ncbi:Mitochondrial division protein 1-like [Oopsacas minuta]|uniref:Mitochondrial division protein 1-like n=1 Tax=Oopsacas minuta TaxID=111878 RepID=A0AAV7K763_9METZ|nr:Mitochondrial division protein 1-like [Oopsacas minuta]
MSDEYRDSIRSAPDNLTEDLSHLPFLPPRTSLSAIHTEQYIHTPKPSDNSIGVIVLPELAVDVTSNELIAREQQRLNQLTRWSEKYRDWQVRLVLVVIAKYIPMRLVRLFNTILIPYLHPYKYTDYIPTIANTRQLDIATIPLSVKSADFYSADQLGKVRKVKKKVKRPGTIFLVQEFRTELQCFQKWITCDYAPLLLIKFIAGLVRICSYSQLQLFASYLQERMCKKLELHFLPDTILTRVFSYLDPYSLYSASAVSKCWRKLALDPELWRQHVKIFGEREGIQDLDCSIELGETIPIDYRDIYTQLYKIQNNFQEGVSQRIKDLFHREMNKGTMEFIPSPEFHSNSNSPLHTLGMKPKNTVNDMDKVVREKCKRPRKKTNKKLYKDRQLIASSKSPILPVIECKKGSVVTLRASNKSHTTPMPSINSTIEHKGVSDWRVFDFVQLQVKVCSSESVIIDSRLYTCLTLAGCIPSTHSSNQDTNLPSPLFPLRSVRLFTQSPQLSLFSVACDSRRVLVGSTDLIVRLYDSRSGREIGCLEGHKGIVNCIAMSQGVVVTGSWDCTVIVWDAVNFQILYVIHAHSEKVTQVAVNNKIVVSCCKDGEVCIWRRGSWDLITRLILHKNSVTGLVITDKYIYTSSLDGTIGIWRNNSYQREAVLNIGSSVTCLAITLGLCVAGCDTGHIRLWNLVSRREEITYFNSSPELYEQVISSFLGKETHSTPEETVSIKRLDVYLMVNCTKPAPVQSVAILNSFVFASNGAAIYQWSMTTCSLARVMLAHSAPVSCLTADRFKLVSVGEDGRVVLWHTRNKPPDVSHFVEPLIIYGDLKQITI